MSGIDPSFTGGQDDRFLAIAAADHFAAGTPTTAPERSAHLASDASSRFLTSTSPEAETNQDVPSKKPNQFEFISEQNEASRRRARAHVMRDYMRKRRQQEVDRYKASQLERAQSSTTRSQLDPPLALAVTASGDRPYTTYGSSRHESEPAFEIFSTGGVSSGEEPGRENTLARRALRRAPKRSLKSQDTSTIPKRLFGIRYPAGSSPWESLLRLWSQYPDPLGFKGILCYGAVHLSELQSDPNASLALTMKTALIRSVNKTLRLPSDARDNSCLLFAIACLAIAERGTGDSLGVSTHQNAARALIQNAGGLQGLLATNSPSVGRHLFCTILTLEILLQQTAATDWGLAWDGSALSPFSQSYFQFDVQPRASNTESQLAPLRPMSKTELTAAIFEQFSQFLHACFRLAIEVRKQSQRSQFFLPTFSGQEFLTFSSPLHELSRTILPILILKLSPPRRSSPYIALLIFFNLILWAFRHHPSDLDLWLQRLRFDIAQLEISASGDPFGLLVMTAWREDTKAPSEVDERWIWWFTSRLTRLCSKLSDDAWERVKIFLTGCLMFDADPEDVMNIQSLNVEALRREVLGLGYGFGGLTT
ncbi:MAG: hypothetical protein Q9227_009553 [Pyrenula ochraceoflavens]